MYYVYILKSLKDDKHYIGFTENLERRIKEHNEGKTKSIINRRPFKLIYSEKYDNLDDAIKREKKIKSYKGGRAFRDLISGGVA